MPNPLAHELKTLRELAGLTGRDLAKVTGLSQSKVSRIESGARAPTNDELKAWVAATGADKHTLHHLQGLNAEAHALKPDYCVLRNIEQRADSIRVFDPAGIPALLWTPMYAWQVMQTLPDHDRGTHAAFVQGLQDRQAPLLSGLKNYEFILTQHAIPPPTTPINRGLIGRILSLEGMAKIIVITDHSPLIDRAKTAFTLYEGFTDEDDDTAVVGIPAPHTELPITTADHVAAYRTLFDQLTAYATEIVWPQLRPQPEPPGRPAPTSTPDAQGVHPAHE